MQEYLDEFVESLKKSLGENLVSVVLYGERRSGENISSKDPMSTSWSC